MSQQPWTVNEIGDWGNFHICNSAVGHIARLDAGSRQEYESTKANAAHIVRCVNAHDKLVEALKDLFRAVTSFENWPEEGQWKELMDARERAEVVIDSLAAAKGE